ncbi:MAG: alkaline phosphatase family protein [Clostridia bacterium]|nr:alkaline phosphatase family protein [Clostridia bacterium]
MQYENIVLPDYDHCILGTMSSILKNYNVECATKSNKALDKILAEKKYKNIIFMILDGLGEYNLNEISKDGFFKQNQIDCVTSVFPSTTTAALPAYYSGKVPYETGWIAWSQYFKEYGRALDTFSHKESYLGETIKKPLKDVFESDMNYKSIFYQIEEASPDVKAFEVQPEYAERRAKRSIRANNIDELIYTIEDLVTMPSNNFILAYSDNPDGLLHKFGTDSDEAKEFVLDAERKIQELRNKLGDDSLIIVTADHGHKNITNAYTILDYPELMECLIIPPSLESRCLSFWVKEEMKDIFVERFNNLFEKEFWLMTKEEFLDKYKMLGTGNKHKKIDDFIGNYIAISVNGSMIRLETFIAEGKPLKKSTHCGLSKEEMAVPVIALK